MSKLNKELVFLDIFYSQLSYVDIQTIPAYDLLTLVCDIGGALGLILGGTLLTIVEFAQLFVQLFTEIVTSVRGVHPPEAMMHLPPCFRFPPIFETFSEFPPYFSCVSTFPPCFAKFFISPPL